VAECERSVVVQTLHVLLIVVLRSINAVSCAKLKLLDLCFIISGIDPVSQRVTNDLQSF